MLCILRVGGRSSQTTLGMRGNVEHRAPGALYSRESPLGIMGPRLSGVNSGRPGVRARALHSAAAIHSWRAGVGLSAVALEKRHTINQLL